MIGILIHSIIKIGLLASERIFVTIDGMSEFESIPDMTFDAFEVIIHSPRFLALFTMCFMARAKFTGRQDTLSAVQFTILRNLPAYIAFQACCDSMIRRQLVLTMDDVIFIVIYIIVRDSEF